MDKAVTLTREELYKKVWAQPLRTIAAQFGISDVALAKRCRKLDVPLPGRGYWAKIAAGKKPRPRSLPPLRGSTPSLTVFEPPRPPAEPKVVSPVVAKIEAMEKQVESKIIVPEALWRPHALIQQTIDDLKLQKRKAPGWSWDTSSRLDIDVSEALFDRAILIFDTLLKAVDQRGWKTVILKEDYRSRSCVEVLGQRVPIGIRERIKKVKNEPAKPVRTAYGEYTPYQTRYRDEPSGLLCLVIRSRWRGMTAIEKSWDDSASRRIEDQLNAFLVGIASQAEEWNEWNRRREENERTRLEEEQRRAKEVARQEAEERRRRGLEQEAQHWVMSQNIRAYLDAVRDASGPEEGRDAALASWLQWADAHAARLDPLQRRISTKQ